MGSEQAPADLTLAGLDAGQKRPGPTEPVEGIEAPLQETLQLG